MIRSKVIVINLMLSISFIVSCGRVDRPSENLLEILGDMEVEGSLRTLSYNVRLNHTGLGFAPLYFVPCSQQRQRELPDALLSWAWEYPQIPFAIFLQEADHSGFYDRLKRGAAQRGWTVVPSNFSEVKSGLVMVTSAAVVSSEYLSLEENSRSALGRDVQLSKVLVDGHTIDLLNTQTTSGSATHVLDVHTRQLNRFLGILEDSAVQGKAIAGGNFNFGPSTVAAFSEHFSTWFIGRLPPWWHWSMPKSALENPEEQYFTWDPEANPLAQHWSRLNNGRSAPHGPTWKEARAQLSHFFHTHSVNFEYLGLREFALQGNCNVALSLDEDKEPLQRHQLSDHIPLEALFSFN